MNFPVLSYLMIESGFSNVPMLRGKYGQWSFYESEACQVFILHVVGHFCAQRFISTLSDRSGLCRGTVDGQIICHNFSQPSISPSCRPTSDLGSQWKGEDLAQDPWKIAKVPYSLLPCGLPPPTLQLLAHHFKSLQITRPSLNSSCFKITL